MYTFSKFLNGWIKKYAVVSNKDWLFTELNTGKIIKASSTLDNFLWISEEGYLNATEDQIEGLKDKCIEYINNYKRRV